MDPLSNEMNDVHEVDNSRNEGLVLQAPQLIQKGPQAVRGIHQAGAVGQRWYDAAEFGAIRCIAWDQSINNSDAYEAGAVLFATSASPNVIPDADLPPTVAQSLTSQFKHMVFDSLSYEIVSSKGSLTNAKLALAFIPDMTLEEFNNLSTKLKWATVDRIDSRTIFSPSPNVTAHLEADWSYNTNFASTDSSMGVITLMIYQKVVANLSSGDNSNTIQLTMRMATNGLKVRYAVPKGVSQASKDIIALDQLRQMAPVNPDYEGEDAVKEDVVDYAAPTTTEIMHQTPVLTIVPAAEVVDDELIDEILPTLVTPEGKIFRHATGIAEITSLDQIRWQISTMTHPITDCTKLTVTRFDEVTTPSEPALYSVDLFFNIPYEIPDGHEIVDNPDIKHKGALIVEDNRTGYINSMFSEDTTQFETKYDETNKVISVRLLNILTNVGDLLVGDQSGRLVKLHLACANLVLQPIAEPDLSSIPADAGIPFFGTNDEDPEKIVNDILSGSGRPSVPYTTNFLGGNQGDRQGEFQADLIVRSVNETDARGNFGEELLGTFSSVAELALPFVSLLLRDSSFAKVVESTKDFPITMVPTDRDRSMLKIKRSKRLDLSNAIRRARKFRAARKIVRGISN